MIATLAERTASKLVEYGSVKKDEYEEYVYAITMIMTIMVTDVTTMAIGLLMGMFWECVGFCFVYKLLRKYCGGYHFSTSLRCYLSSCIMCPVALLMIMYCPYNLWLLSSVLLFSVIVLLILSPVEAVNKPLDEKERKVFGGVARVSVILLLVCWIIFATLHLVTVTKVMAISIAFVALFAIIGKIHLKTLKKCL